MAIPPVLVFGYPLRATSSASEIVQGIEHGEWAQSMIGATRDELLEEREAVEGPSAMTNQAPPRTDVPRSTTGDQVGRPAAGPWHRGRGGGRHLEAARRDRADHPGRRLRRQTGATRSAITFWTARRGILRYRGYPIEELAERSTFLEVAYLLIHGEAPTRAELDHFVAEITHHPSSGRDAAPLRLLPARAHPMAVLASGTVGMSTFYPDSHEISDPAAVQPDHAAADRLPYRPPGGVVVHEGDRQAHVYPQRLTPPRTCT